LEFDYLQMSLLHLAIQRLWKGAQRDDSFN